MELHRTKNRKLSNKFFDTYDGREDFPSYDQWAKDVGVNLDEDHQNEYFMDRHEYTYTKGRTYDETISRRTSAYQSPKPNATLTIDSNGNIRDTKFSLTKGQDDRQYTYNPETGTITNKSGKTEYTKEEALERGLTENQWSKLSGESSSSGTTGEDIGSIREKNAEIEAENRRRSEMARVPEDYPTKEASGNLTPEKKGEPAAEISQEDINAAAVGDNTINRGDTLWKYSERLTKENGSRISVTTLAAFNGIEDPNMIIAGEGIDFIINKEEITSVRGDVENFLESYRETSEQFAQGASDYSVGLQIEGRGSIEAEISEINDELKKNDETIIKDADNYNRWLGKVVESLEADEKDINNTMGNTDILKDIKEMQ